jgi:hypothetical protein
MMKLWFSFLLVAVGFNFCGGQKVLQVERFGKAETKKIYIGEELNYRVKGDKTWYEGTIQDILVDDGIVLFDQRYVRVDEITSLRKRMRWSKPFGRQLYTFAGGWLLFSAGGTLVGWEFGWDTVIIAGAAVVTGFLIQKIFRFKKYKIGKRRRLRLLDLTITKPFLGST